MGDGDSPHEFRGQSPWILIATKYLLNPVFQFRRYFVMDDNHLFVVQYTGKGKIA